MMIGVTNMFNYINKNKVVILWIISITILFVSIIIAQTDPFSEKASAVIVGTSFNLALVAMILHKIGSNDKNKKVMIVIYIVLMLYTTFDSVLKFLR